MLPVTSNDIKTYACMFLLTVTKYCLYVIVKLFSNVEITLNYLINLKETYDSRFSTKLLCSITSEFKFEFVSHINGIKPTGLFFLSNCC